MGNSGLPPFGLSTAVTTWQFAPIVTASVAVMAGLYLWGVVRVKRRHPARPWPLWRTAMFLAGLLVIVAATQSGIGSYDDVLFWDHMIQHLMLIMVAPPLLVVGQPVTLLLHASRNPVHTWTKRLLRSWLVAVLTWPPLGVLAYTATIIGTHLTGFMNLAMQNGAVHNAEHALYLVVGYLYFLPLLGREPVRWRVSYPIRLFLLFIAMPVDAYTGVVLGSAGTAGFMMDKRSWGPSPIDDVHIGGAVMWVGGAAIMFVMIMFVFLAWTRDTRVSSANFGLFESARRNNLAQVANTQEDVRDADDEQSLDAYNAYLARLNGDTR